MAGRLQKTEAVMERQTDDMELIENLREKHGISRAVFAGACAVNGWKAGKVLTPKQFLDGIAAFTGKAMYGRPRREKGENNA